VAKPSLAASSGVASARVHGPRADVLHPPSLCCLANAASMIDWRCSFVRIL
jgi:hypothetical protein